MVGSARRLPLSATRDAEDVADDGGRPDPAQVGPEALRGNLRHLQLAAVAFASSLHNQSDSGSVRSCRSTMKPSTVTDTDTELQMTSCR